MNWFDFQQKNKPQSNAVSSGIIFYMTSGYHAGWGIFNIYHRNEKWTSNETNFFINLTINAYYIGTIFGLLLSIVLQSKLSKKVIYCISSVITIVTSILLICWPTSGVIIMIVRLVFGITNGLILPVTIIHASEVVIKEMRGMLLSTYSYCYNLGLLVMLAILIPFNFDRDIITIEAITMVGILGLVNGLMALPLGYILFIESPIYLLTHNRPDDALNAIQKLRKDKFVTQDIILDYNDMKTLIDEDNKLRPSIFSDQNVRPLMVVGLVVLLNVISLNMPINLIRVISIEVWSANSLIVTISAILIRSIIGIFPIMTIDKIGRRKILLISGILSGLTLIMYGILINTIDVLSLSLRITIFLAYEVFHTFGLSAIPFIYMAEAFPLTKKFNSIVATIILESLVHIALIASTLEIVFTISVVSLFVCIFGSLMVLIALSVHNIVPETAMLTLREARRKFKLV